MLAAAQATGASARWLRAETEHFVVYSDGAEAELRDYAEKLEDFDWTLRLFHDADSKAQAGKFEVYLVSGLGELHEVSPQAGDTVAGFYVARPNGIFAIASRANMEGIGKDYVIFHEYVHHFMMQYFNYGYATWLNEGWAEYFAATTIRGDVIEVGKYSDNRAYWLANGDWLPLKKLLAYQSSITKSNETGFYPESWLLTHYMLADPTRKRQLAAYVQAVGTGADPVKAMEAASGIKVDALDRQIQTYMKSRISYHRLTRKVHAASEVTITTLSPGADDMLLRGQGLKLGVEEADQAKTLAGIRKRAAQHPGDRLATLVQARAEVSFGDRAAGEALLRALLERDPNDAEALRLMATSRLLAGDADPANQAKDYAEARPYVGRAFKLDDADYQALYLYARARSLDADYPSDNTLNALIAAHLLAPQVAAISIHTARALIRRERYTEAAEMLTVVANAPHGGDDAKTAKDLLTEIEAKIPPKAAPAASEAAGGG